MSDFEDELESIEEYAETEYEDDANADWDGSSDDLEADQWSKRFGESYVEDYYDADELDDAELERLETEFFEDAGEVTEYGQLDELDPEDDR